MKNTFKKLRQEKRLIQEKLNVANKVICMQCENQAEMLYDTIEKYENRSCDNCKNASFEIKFGELEFNACFLVSNGNVCKWESK